MKLAADANVLLSALIGGQATRVLRHPAIEEILTTEVTLAEVQEYAGQLALKRRLPVDVVLLAAATLPVTIVPRSVYSSCIAEARKRIGGRDPDDVELLALATQSKIPVWSNDNDFENVGVVWYTTATLLSVLEANALDAK
ncbi:MAG TPA: PIN domain-containing protein [Bryobacteraceae bacterium]|nr:PIN domain-containing protein [Bryobacteraceae bacterium]